MQVVENLESQGILQICSSRLDLCWNFDLIMENEYCSILYKKTFLSEKTYDTRPTVFPIFSPHPSFSPPPSNEPLFMRSGKINKH